MPRRTIDCTSLRLTARRDLAAESFEGPLENPFASHRDEHLYFFS